MLISVVSINIEIQLVFSRQVISFLRLTLAIVHLYDMCNLQYTAISKNVVGENEECQLSNGNCTTERKCGY